MESDTAVAKMAKLRISRTSDRDIKMRGLEVLLDDQHLTDLSYGKQAEFEIEPGEHTITITNTVYTKKDRFTIGAGRTAAYEIANIVTGLGSVMISAFGIGPYRVELRKLA
jgi:hypothetical protein